MGASTRAIYGDVCDRCFEDVYARWRAATAAPAGITDLAGKTGLAGKTALAGITDFRSLFFLQAMAADTGLRTVLRIHHHFNTAAHEAFGARAFRALSDERLGCSGERWASEAARLVLSLPSAADGTAQRNSNLGEANQRALGSRALVSWVMAET
jgi:hypothetical protein